MYFSGTDQQSSVDSGGNTRATDLSTDSRAGAADEILAVAGPSEHSEHARESRREVKLHDSDRDVESVRNTEHLPVGREDGAGNTGTVASRIDSDADVPDVPGVDNESSDEGSPKVSEEFKHMKESSEDDDPDVAKMDVDFIRRTSITPWKYDASKMLEYEGPSSRQEVQVADSIALADLANTDENDELVDILLSSETIPFFVDRPKGGWSGTARRMLISVPKNRYQETISILTAAIKAKVLESVPDDEGLGQ